MLRRAHFITRRKYVAALATELAAPILRLAARARAGRAPAPAREWRRGLIIGPTHIGDVLYRTPSLSHLRAGLPDCEWDMLSATPSRPMLRGNPYVRDDLPLNTGDFTWTLAPGGFAALRERRYDVALCTSSHGVHTDLALAAALGIPSRVAYTYKGMSGLVTHAVPLRYPDSYPGHVRQIIAHVIGRAPDWDLTPEVFLDEADVAEADRVWAEEGLDDGNAPIAATITGRQRGVWPSDVLLAPVRLLHEALGAPVVLCGGPSEAEALASAARRAGLPVRVLAGRLSLRGFAAFLRRARMLLASDSGPRHVGNAVGVPVAFARNITTRLIDTGHYCDNEAELVPDAPELVPLQRLPEVVRGFSPQAMADRALAHLAAREAAAGDVRLDGSRC